MISNRAMRWLAVLLLVAAVLVGYDVGHFVWGVW